MASAAVATTAAGEIGDPLGRGVAEGAQAANPREAYETVIREDKVEAYQAYLVLYPSQSDGSGGAHHRRAAARGMIAWYEAVTINTVASYQSFLASYA